MGELFTALSFKVDNLRSSDSLNRAEQVRRLGWSRQKLLRSRSIEYRICGLVRASGGSERNGSKRSVCCEVWHGEAQRWRRKEADVI